MARIILLTLVIHMIISGSLFQIASIVINENVNHATVAAWNKITDTFTGLF